jgi:hypothetical protein
VTGRESRSTTVGPLDADARAAELAALAAEAQMAILTLDQEALKNGYRNATSGLSVPTR